MVKTVVIVNDFAFINGGAGKVAISSAKALVSCGIRTILFSAVAPIDPFLQKNGVEVICLEQHDILSSPNRLKAIIQGIWNKKAHDIFAQLLDKLDESTTIIHFHGWSKAISASIWRTLSNRKFEVVVTLHDYFLFCPNLGLYNYKKNEICTIRPFSLKCYLCNCDSRNYFHKIWRSFRQLIQLRQLRNTNKFNLITIGRTNRKLSREPLDQFSKKIFFLQNPIDSEGKNRISVENNSTYVFMGRLSPEKGIYLFCEAITSLKLQGVVIGDGYIKDDLKQKYPHITFVGWKTGKEKMDILKQAKCFVFPSLWYEGAPLTIVEMLLLGIPCIVPDRCAASELISEGDNGFIFPIGSCEGLKAAIQRCEKIDIKQMSNYIVNTIDYNKFTMETHISSLLKIYNEILTK